MNTLIYIAIVVIQIMSIIDVARSHKETLHKALWIIAIIFFPVLGSLAWYLVSRKVF